MPYLHLGCLTYGLVAAAVSAALPAADCSGLRARRAQNANQTRSPDDCVRIASKPGLRSESPGFVAGTHLFGDFDGDNDVDLRDHTEFAICINSSGPGVIPLPGCAIFDKEPDDDIDLADCAAFVDAFTASSVCGNGIPETGEECDDGNTADGDGCDSNCQVEVAGPTNDSCSSPTLVGDGTHSFSSVDATTDGPDEPNMCDFFDRTNIQSDVWYCYTASYTDEVLVSLCGSDFDTKMAVYEGCGCPTQEPLACSDDDCGTGVESVQSRITFQAAAGHDYLIRIGGYMGEQGDGRLTIECGADPCGTGTGDCFVESPIGDPGCGDPACCETTCELDRYCCDVTWDAFCAGEAAGVCTDGFPACQTGIGSCSLPRDPEPGCGNVNCCNTVCDTDPYCCINEWDGVCVDEANAWCSLTCDSRAGDCFVAHEGPGCNDISCCQAICPDDPFCCETEWDEECADQAATLCVQ